MTLENGLPGRTVPTSRVSTLPRSDSCIAFGLLEYLLEHEVRVAALLGVLDVPRDLLRLPRDGPPILVDDVTESLRDPDDLAVHHVDHPVRVPQQGRDVARDEVLAVPQADDERALVPRRDDLAPAGRHDREGVGPLDPS